MRDILSGLILRLIAAFQLGASVPRTAPAPKTAASASPPATSGLIGRTPSPGSPALTIPHVSETGYTSALVCGSCHADIYKSWKNSMHAFSTSDPVFEVAFMQAIKEQPSARALCLGCHAPTT